MARYEKQVWQNGPGGSTPLSASRLNKIETQFDRAIESVEADIADENSGIGTALRTTIDGRVADRAKRAVASSAAVGALMEKMKAAVDPAVIVGLGDSTMANASGWFNQLAGWLGSTFPTYRVERRDWSHANQRYEPVPTVVQAAGGRRGFVATGASTDRFFQVADSAATSPSTDIIVDFDVLLPGSISGTVALGGKYPNTGSDPNNRGWFAQITAAGILEFYFSTDGAAGTQSTRVSTAALPSAALGVPAMIRFDWTGDDGAGNNVTKFFYSLDRGATWVQIGATVTTATPNRTIFNSTRPTQLNGRSGVGNTTGGAVTYYGMKLYTSHAAGAAPVIDLDTALWNGYGSNATSGTNVAQFTDWAGNTVQIDGTGNLGVMSGPPVLFVLNGAVSGQTISYANDATRFPKLTPSPADLAFINFSHNEIGLVTYRAPYKQLADALIAKWPDVGIVATVQNQRKSPATNIVEHAIRGDQIRSLSASQRYAVVDIRAAFAATADPNALVDADGIHPTPDGYTVATAEAVSLFEQWQRVA